MPLIFLMYAFFAMTFPIGKNLLNHADILFIVATRMLVAGFLLLIYLKWIKKEKVSVAKKHLPKLFLAAFFNIFLTNALEFWSLRHLTPAKTCFIYNLSPFLSAVFSYFILSEKFTLRKLSGLIIGFVGMIPILYTQSPEEALLQHFSFLSQAELTMITAVCSTAIGWIIMKQLISKEGVSPMLATASTQVLGGFMSLLGSLYLENWNPIPVSNTLAFLKLSLLMLIISNLIAYNMYGYLLQRFTAPFVSFSGFSTPIFAALFTWLLREKSQFTSLNAMLVSIKGSFDVYFFASTLIVFIGLQIFYFEELKLGYIQPPPSSPHKKTPKGKVGMY